MIPPFGISQFTTWTQTFAEDLRLYREAGIAYLEVCEAKLDPRRPEPQLRALQASGLRVASVQPRFHSPYPNSLRPVPAAPSERMRRLRASIRLFGRYFPGTTLVVNTGLAPGGDLASAWRTSVREFRRAAVYAADHGVRLALEPLNPIYMNTDTFICSLAQGRRLIDAVDHPAFGVFLDVWHYPEETDSAAEVRKFGPRIFGVHISDWRLPRAFADRVLPGQGELPLVPMLRTIRQAGYSGIYTLEIFSDLRLRGSLWAHPRRTVLEGQKAFAKLWKQIRK